MAPLKTQKIRLTFVVPGSKLKDRPWWIMTSSGRNLHKCKFATGDRWLCKSPTLSFCSFWTAINVVILGRSALFRNFETEMWRCFNLQMENFITASSQSCQTLRVKYKRGLFPPASDGLCVIRNTLWVCVCVLWSRCYFSIFRKPYENTGSSHS